MTTTRLKPAPPENAAATDVHTSWAGPVDLPLDGEADVQAACGVTHVHGRRYGKATPLPIAYCTCAAEVLAAQACLAGQCSAELGRPICHARTSVAQAALLLVGQHLAAATADTDEWIESHQPGGPPFTSRDGVRYEIESLEPDGWAGFWARLGAPGHAVARGWRPFQHRFASACCPLPDELFAAAADAEYLTAARAARDSGVGITALRESPHHMTGYVHSPVLPETPTNAHRGSVPAACSPVRAPLKGIIVVESTRRVQGPLAGHLLHQLGAHVLRVEPPDGDPLRGTPPVVGPAVEPQCSARFHALNRGKEIIEADLSRRRGQETLRDLVAGADVFLHNWAPGKANRWRLDDVDLSHVRPGLVYVWASGWFGAPGRRHPTGTDYMVQARSGLAGRLAQPGQPPTPSLLTLIDVLGALVCVERVLAALLIRLRTGRGGRVDSSLYAAAELALRRAPLLPVDAALSPDIKPVRDLAAMAADPRFAAALDIDGCALVRAPWEFYTC